MDLDEIKDDFRFQVKMALVSSLLHFTWICKGFDLTNLQNTGNVNGKLRSTVD